VDVKKTTFCKKKKKNSFVARVVVIFFNYEADAFARHLQRFLINFCKSDSSKQRRK
jgi:hypothetical protein